MSTAGTDLKLMKLPELQWCCSCSSLYCICLPVFVSININWMAYLVGSLLASSTYVIHTTGTGIVLCKWCVWMTESVPNTCTTLLEFEWGLRTERAAKRCICDWLTHEGCYNHVKREVDYMSCIYSTLPPGSIWVPILMSASCFLHVT